MTDTENSSPQPSPSMPSLEAALGYLRRGWSILPVGRDKRPVEVEPGKRFSWESYQGRLPGEDEVKRWFSQWPDAGVGIICGTVSRLAVLDCDPRHGGEDTLATLFSEGRKLPDTPVVQTGGGGTHFYFKTDGQVPTIPSILPGLDLKAAGSYCVAPPSRHPSGGIYEWLVDPGMAPLAPLPDWLAKLIEQGRQPRAASGLPKVLSEGERNSVLFKFAAALRYKGMETPGILAALRAENESRCKPPLPNEELANIAQSAIRYPPGPEPPGNGQKTPPQSYETKTWADLVDGDLPPVPWVVERLLPEASSLILGGYAGTGKSWLLLSLAACIASGRPWLDHFPTKPQRVLYLDEENSEFELCRRLHRLTAGYGFTRDLPIEFSSGTGLRLSEADRVKRLEATIQAHQAQVVVIDALIRVLGGDENDASKVAQAFSRVKGLMSSLGAAFIFADHHRKPSPFDPGPEFALRGSSDKSAWPDSILTIRRSRTTRQLQVIHTKARFGATVRTFGFALEDSSDGTVFKYEEVAEEEERASAIAEAKESLLALFTTSEVSLTRKELVKSLEGEASERWGDEALRDLVSEGKLAKVGRGPKVRYVLPQPDLAVAEEVF